MSYDGKCEELAIHFLPSDTSQQTVQLLAQRIQDFVEDEIRDYELREIKRERDEA